MIQTFHGAHPLSVRRGSRLPHILRRAVAVILLFSMAQVGAAAADRPAEQNTSPIAKPSMVSQVPPATQAACRADGRVERPALGCELRPHQPPVGAAVTFEDHFAGPQLDRHWIAKGGGNYRLSAGHLEFATEAGDLGPGVAPPKHLFLMEIPAELTRWTAVARVRYAGAGRPYEQVCLVTYLDNGNCMKVGYVCGGDIRGIGTMWQFYGYCRGREYKGGYEVPRCDEYFWLRLVRDGNLYRAYAGNDSTQDPNAVRWTLVDTLAMPLESRFVGIGGWNSGATGGRLAEFDTFRFNEGVPDPISRFDQSLQEVCMSLDNADPEEFGHLLYWTTLWAHETPQWLSEFVRRRRGGEPSLAMIRAHLASPEMLQYACRRCGAQGLPPQDPVEFVRTAYRELLVRDPLPEDERRGVRALIEGTSRPEWLRELLGSGEATCRAAERVLRIIQARDARNIRPRPMPKPMTSPPCALPADQTAKREPGPRASRTPTSRTVFATLPIRTRTEGLIEKVLVKPGQRVAENDVLVQLDQEETEMEVRKARVLLKAAADEFNRCKGAHARGTLDSQDLSEAEAEMRLAEIELERCQNRLRRLRVVSPYAGVIVQLEPDLQGKKVQAGELLMRLEQRP